MFKTKRLTLRGYRSSDEGFFLDLFDNYNVIANLADDYAAPNLGGHRDMLEKMTKCALFVVVQDSETSETMGFTLVSISTPRNLDGDLGMALAEKYWGNGYATEILEWLKDYSFKILGLRRLSLFVFSSNKRATSLYEHSGFSVEGRKRQAVWKEGQWVDIIWMGLLSSEYSSEINDRKMRSGEWVLI